ncbi:MAG: hypothetical protein ACJ72Z_07190 [Pyrinomonadaceae bacterium]
MDLKDELENELALAILIEMRQARNIDADASRELIWKIKGALASSDSPDPDIPEIPAVAATR